MDIKLRDGIATPPEEDRATAKGELHNKFHKDPQGGVTVLKVGYNFDPQTFCIPGASAFCDGTSRYGVPENLTTG